jgi:NAD-dependent SIR2 family protein deacetylase
VLRRWAETRPAGTFVFTSNVDGQFQKAGFDSKAIVECHGSIHSMQCLRHCGQPVFTSDPFTLMLDPETCRAAPPYPTCPACHGPARPNILMFGDFEWDSQPTADQETRLRQWLSGPTRLVVVECGAGGSVPTVRQFSEQVCRTLGATLVRINPRESQVPADVHGVSVSMPAQSALQAMAQEL